MTINDVTCENCEHKEHEVLVSEDGQVFLRCTNDSCNVCDPCEYVDYLSENLLKSWTAPYGCSK